MVTETSALVERHNIHTQNKTKEEVPAQNVELSAVRKENHFCPLFCFSVCFSLGLLSFQLTIPTIYPACIAKWLQFPLSVYSLYTQDGTTNALHDWMKWSAIYTMHAVKCWFIDITVLHTRSNRSR